MPIDPGLGHVRCPVNPGTASNSKGIMPRYLSRVESLQEKARCHNGRMPGTPFLGGKGRRNGTGDPRCHHPRIARDLSRTSSECASLYRHPAELRTERTPVVPLTQTIILPDVPSWPPDRLGPVGGEGESATASPSHHPVPRRPHHELALQGCGCRAMPGEGDSGQGDSAGEGLRAVYPPPPPSLRTPPTGARKSLRGSLARNAPSR